MNRTMWIALLFVLPACDSVSITLDLGRLQPNVVTLRLVNNADLPVDPGVYISDLENVIIPGITESLLTLDGNLQNFPLLAAGGVEEYVYDCDDFKAVTVEDAELVTGIPISPDDSTSILIDGDDFECGDTVQITYSGNLLGFDARISAAPSS